ncbi:MAG: sugar transferase [Chloroflexi bacterium]|nr:sugar transferase [Chloroflexota bacterium]
MSRFQTGIPPFKRIFDVLTALMALLILSPLLLIIIFISWIGQGLPIFYSQQRPGFGGKVFRLWKFRTMTNKYDVQGNLLPDEQRITRWGNFLRKTSLDELPELWNVVKGEMSWVGPRPLLVQYLERYSPEQARRHAVLPGITGWAQVNGRNAISWQRKFELDVWYVDHWSFGLDLKIMWLTVWKVISGKGISQPGRVTMEEFMGNEEKDG